MKNLRTCYEQNKFNMQGKQEDELLQDIIFYMFYSDAPAYVIKVLAETYNKDFWELWAQIKDVARRRREYRMSPVAVPSISTADFFKQDPDDMILFWEGDGRIEFSNDLKKWFSDLKRKYDELVRNKFIMEKPLNWIIDLMEYADENYYHIYTMNDFFEKTVEHLNETRYLSLWKIYDEMLNDPELEEAENVIFVPEGPEYEHTGLTYWGEQPRRRL